MSHMKCGHAGAHRGRSALPSGVIHLLNTAAAFSAMALALFSLKPVKTAPPRLLAAVLGSLTGMSTGTGTRPATSRERPKLCFDEAHELTVLAAPAMATVQELCVQNKQALQPERTSELYRLGVGRHAAGHRESRDADIVHVAKA